MNSLVVGYGSIGARHARILTELGNRTSVVSHRQVDYPICYHQLEEAIIKEEPAYVIIANETSRHKETLDELVQLNYRGVILVEKPLFDKVEDVTALPENVFVGYNLRFHPLVVRLRDLLHGETVISVQAYVGQYLPDWRPATDYRSSYSASREKGGGALRDLSHELDYLLWLFGSWQRVSAIGGQFSSLEISSDDSYSLLISCDCCPALSLQMNYVDRRIRRFVIVNTLNHTFEIDFIKGTVTADKTTDDVITERDYTYKEMHRAVLTHQTADLCSWQQGLDVLRLIEAAEAASTAKEWIFS